MNLFQHYGKSIPTYKAFVNSKKMRAVLAEGFGLNNGDRGGSWKQNTRNYLAIIKLIGGVLFECIERKVNYSGIEWLSSFKTSGNNNCTCAFLFINM